MKKLSRKEIEEQIRVAKELAAQTKAKLALNHTGSWKTKEEIERSSRGIFMTVGLVGLDGRVVSGHPDNSERSYQSPEQ